MPPARQPSICVGSFSEQCLEVVDLHSPRPTMPEGSPLASWSRSPIRTITAALASRKPDCGHAGDAALARGRKAQAVHTLGRGEPAPSHAQEPASLGGRLIQLTMCWRWRSVLLPINSTGHGIDGISPITPAARTAFSPRPPAPCDRLLPELSPDLRQDPCAQDPA